VQRVLEYHYTQKGNIDKLKHILQSILDEPPQYSILIRPR